MSSIPDEQDEETRKRLRNRIAQQKYRKKLKSHIENLEKRAAAADQHQKVDVHTSTAAPAVTHPHDDNEQSRRAPPNLDDTTLYWPDASSVNTSSQTGDRALMNFEANSLPITMPTEFLSRTQPTVACQESCPSPTRGMNSIGPRPARSLSHDLDFLEDFVISGHGSWMGVRKNPPFPENQDMEIRQNDIRFGSSSMISRQEDLGILNKPGHNVAKSTGSAPSPGVPPAPELQEHLNLGSRVDRILRFMQSLGFESVDRFVSYYYTTGFGETSSAKTAQEASRKNGLPQFLEDLKTNESSWSMWESSGYRDAIIRSAARLVAEEFERLAKKMFTAEMELKQSLSPPTANVSIAGGDSPSLDNSATELQKMLQDELPNLKLFIETMSTEDGRMSQLNKIKLLVATIRMITAPGSNPMQEATDWVLTRASS